MTARLRSAGPALILLAALVGLWQLLVWALAVPEWLFPAPSAVAADFGRDGGLLARNTWVTLREVLLGFALAVAGGVALGISVHVSRTLRRALYPILLASQAVPIVVVAPILAIALGYDLAPKLAVVGLVCFFPIVVGVADGLAAVDEQYRRMMLTLHASPFAIFRRVEFPASLPSLFSGLRVAAAYAAVGAVFGEWAGASAGLGYVMLQAAPALETPRIFAAVAILTAISLALFAAVTLLERLAAPWAREEGVRAL